MLLSESTPEIIELSLQWVYYVQSFSFALNRSTCFVLLRNNVIDSPSIAIRLNEVGLSKYEEN